MTNEFKHVTVLLHETVDMLDVKPDGIYVDATLGGAGHSSYLLSQLNDKGHLYAFDQDQKAIDNAQIRLADYIQKGQVTFIKSNFRHLKEELAKPEPSLIIARKPCALLKTVKHKPPFHIDSDKCKNCKSCMRIGCPALVAGDKCITIDNTLCVGCGLCEQLCKFDAIKE